MPWLGLVGILRSAYTNGSGKKAIDPPAMVGTKVLRSRNLLNPSLYVSDANTHAWHAAQFIVA
jgi:hypothetical protein